MKILYFKSTLLLSLIFVTAFTFSNFKSNAFVQTELKPVFSCEDTVKNLAEKLNKLEKTLRDNIEEDRRDHEKIAVLSGATIISLLILGIFLFIYFFIKYTDKIKKK
ncbi:MAG: hypothetical protein QM539_06565 [Alphaproteobacteria bacterium]|nr:hypothetical protein [Alphaproteobacteria bacterium]